MYSNMTAVQFDDVEQKLMRVDVFSIIAGQESLGDGVDLFHKGYNGELLCLD